MHESFISVFLSRRDSHDSSSSRARTFIIKNKQQKNKKGKYACITFHSYVTKKFKKSKVLFLTLLAKTQALFSWFLKLNSLSYQNDQKSHSVDCRQEERRR